MSTRSHIAILNGAEGVRTIYCHSDGYPAHNGHILDTYYACQQKIADLIDLGGLSLLGEHVHPDPKKPHRFDYNQRQPGVTIAYGRDRGEKDTGATCYETLEEWHAAMWPWIDYAYLYVGGTWLCAEVTDPDKDTLTFKHVRSMINPEHVQRIFGT
tara:strand:+ start:170 stop:637 length:468 start_codon:yes stop_codon:yes gene_type:complete